MSGAWYVFSINKAQQTMRIDEVTLMMVQYQQILVLMMEEARVVLLCQVRYKHQSLFLKVIFNSILVHITENRYLYLLFPKQMEK